jgi:hypothetical protein
MPVTNTALGFKFEYRLCGQPKTVRTFYFKDSETLHIGDLANLEATSNVGEVDLAATNDTALLGAVEETKAGRDSTTQIEVIIDWDAVYSVYDPNARAMGDLLDISGATGAQTVTTASNNDVRVVANSTADERTLVMIIQAEHALF